MGRDASVTYLFLVQEKDQGDGAGLKKIDYLGSHLKYRISFLI